MLPITDNIPWLIVVLKPIPVLCMAVWLAVQPKKGRYQLLVIAGLILGAAGDVLLEMEGLFIVGLLAFLLGHVAYILAFLQDSRKLFAGKATISNTVLAFTMFVAPIPLSSWIIMLTYWSGQFGVALSAKEQWSASR